MSKLVAGAQAPNFSLPDVDGNFRTWDASSSPLTLAIFFKTSCPTCQYAWKYYERLHTAYASTGLRVLGISQHDADRTRKFQTQYAATFPHLIDDGFAVSQAYDPDFVPTGFLIDSQGTIVTTIESWNSRGMNDFSAEIAQRLKVPAHIIVLAEDGAVASKLG